MAIDTCVTLSGQHFAQGAVPTVVHPPRWHHRLQRVKVSADGTTLTFTMAISHNAFLNGPGIVLFVRNPAPGYGSITPVLLKVTKSCGTTTC